MNQPTKECLTIKHLIILVIFSDFKIAPYRFSNSIIDKPHIVQKLAKKTLPFEKNEFLTFLVCYI
jgi:hypothetical protein